MFCDFYNVQQKVYCKRLKVLCPEHTKEPKVGQRWIISLFEIDWSFFFCQERKKIIDDWKNNLSEEGRKTCNLDIFFFYNMQSLC